MPTALITGASAGMGVEFARLFAADKNDLVLVARRKDKLDALAAELSAKHAISADLMDPASPKAIIAEVARLGLSIDALVNNAGFGTSGPFHSIDADKEFGEVQCNIAALVALTRAFLPGMVSRRSGRILNLGSTAGFQPGPWMATYYASKAFVNSFTQALNFELKGTGVTATLSCPGATATEFATVAGTHDSRLFRMGAMTAAEVAGQAYAAMKSGRPAIVHGLKNKLSALSVRLSPISVVMSIAASLNKSPEPAPALKA